MSVPGPASLSPFVFDALAQRVVFGRDRRFEVCDEIDRLGVVRVLVLSTPEQKAQAGEIVDLLGGHAVGLAADAAMHTPVEVTEQVLTRVEEEKADALVAFGGGSAIGLAKALVLRSGLRYLALPTTFAGSEMTPILGQTEGGVKTTLRDARVLPDVVLYDPAFIETLPPGIAGPSGMNAIAHAVEALYAENYNPIVGMWAEEAIRALGTSLPLIVGGKADRDAYGEALYGAWLAGACLGSVGMAIHHKLAHVLGGSFDLPHAETHSVLLPYTAAYNRPLATDAMARAERALAAEDAPQGLFNLMRQVSPTTSLADLGLSLTDLDRAADLAMSDPYFNPRPVTRTGVRSILEAAYQGTIPGELES